MAAVMLPKVDPAPRWRVLRDVEVAGRRLAQSLTYAFVDRADAERALLQIRATFPTAYVQSEA